MNRVKKIGIICASVIVSIVLFFFFFLYSFPYGSVIKRLDYYLAKNHSVNISAAKIRYRFPMSFVFDEVLVSSEDESLTLTIDHAVLYMKKILFSRVKTVGLSCTGVGFQNRNVEISRALVAAECGVKTKNMLRELDPLAIAWVEMKAEALRVDRLFLSGFEFTSFKIPIFDLYFTNAGEMYSIERGVIKSELFSSEIGGSFGLKEVDGTVTLTLHNEFFRQYAHLRRVVDSVARDGILTLTLKGNIRNPRIAFS
jgi:hypothetical protein